MMQKYTTDNGIIKSSKYTMVHIHNINKMVIELRYPNAIKSKCKFVQIVSVRSIYRIRLLCEINDPKRILIMETIFTHFIITYYTKLTAV